MTSLDDLSIVVLSYNRHDALAHTLEQLAPLGQRGAEIIVVDNASGDGSPELVGERFPWARLIALDQNVAIEGFNIGARGASGAFILILDDDAWPEASAIEHAVSTMRSRPELGGIMLHRKHPRTNEYEWPFDRLSRPVEPWPDMGCANLVRREAWEQVEGYESGFFLYRNDTDLALKLLGAGWQVRFDPSLRAFHDSPVVTVKTPRWFELSTRNWVWMCRRHARGWVRWEGIVLGWLWAHRLARLSLRRHARALRGFLAGLVRPPPPLPARVRPDGSALARLIALKRRLRARRG